MKIYEVKMHDHRWGDTWSKFYASKEKAEAAVAENDSPWKNANGIEFHTAWIEREIEVEE